MKYRTRSSASKLVKPVICYKEAEEKEEVTANTIMKANSDPKEKLFVRKEMDIDLSALLKKYIIGENDLKFAMKDGNIVETSR